MAFTFARRHRLSTRAIAILTTCVVAGCGDHSNSGDRAFKAAYDTQRHSMFRSFNQLNAVLSADGSKTGRQFATRLTQVEVSLRADLKNLAAVSAPPRYQSDVLAIRVAGRTVVRDLKGVAGLALTSPGLVRRAALVRLVSHELWFYGADRTMSVRLGLPAAHVDGAR